MKAKRYYVVSKLLKLCGKEFGGMMSMLPVYDNKREAKKVAGKKYTVWVIEEVI
jgi:hypothetical protein